LVASYIVTNGRRRLLGLLKHGSMATVPPHVTIASIAMGLALLAPPRRVLRRGRGRVVVDE
jgi:hypothetical protein